MTLLRSLGSLAAVLLSFVLWGCAGPQVSKEATPAAIQGRGVVIVSVTHDADTGRRSKAHFFIDQQSKQFETRVVRSVEEMLMITKGSDFDDVHGRVYVLDVEPGLHSIDSWQSAGQAVRITPRVAPAPMRFEVKAGEVVYIGNLNLNHSMGRNLLGISVVASAQPEVRDRRDLDLPIAESKVPSIKGQVQVRLLPLGPWTDRSTGTDRRIETVPPSLLVPPKQP